MFLVYSESAMNTAYYLKKKIAGDIFPASIASPGPPFLRSLGHRNSLLAELHSTLISMITRLPVGTLGKVL